MGKSLTTAHNPETIGALFYKARRSHVDSVQYLLECGRQLTQIKGSLDHGSWMLWLKEHQATLGFTDRTARKLMLGAAKWPSTSNLDDDGAMRVSRQVWGNDPPPRVEIEEHGPEYRQLVRFFEWLKAHPAWTVNSSLSRDEAADIRHSLSDAREWLVSLERAVTALPGSNGRVIENAKGI